MSAFDPRQTPWLVDELDFWEIEDPRAQREFLLRYAVLAPSGHNSQPWSFRITDAGVEVYADYTRRLPVGDPEDRELLMSIGAAIFNLRVAAAHFGFESTVMYGPASNDAMPLALVALRETCNPDPQLARLFPAITKRHTCRTSFEPREIEPDALDAVCEAVEVSDLLQLVVPHERFRTAELVESADKVLMSDDRWRAELADWVRPNETSNGDGISADAFGFPGPLSNLAPQMIRTLDVGQIRGKHDRDLVEHAAGLVVVTGDDDVISLLRSGEALERFLLTLTLHGVQYAFLNQVCEVPTLRSELASILRTAKPPQLLMRIGYGQPNRRPMPRRPVEAAVR